MSVGMSILDFTTGLFRDPVNLRSFVDDRNQAPTSITTTTTTVTIRSSSSSGRTWAVESDHDKGLGDVVDNPLTPEIEGQPVEPADDYPEPRD